jgi:small subunit ribosomal protein S3Ae
MDLTTDKLRSLVKKWRTLVEASVDVKTTDGYILRLFCIAFTKKRPNSQRKTCYAQSSQKRLLRAKMAEIMTKESTTCDLKELVGKFIPEAIGKDIEKACAVGGCVFRRVARPAELGRGHSLSLRLCRVSTLSRTSSSAR